MTGSGGTAAVSRLDRGLINRLAVSLGAGAAAVVLADGALGIFRTGPAWSAFALPAVLAAAGLAALGMGAHGALAGLLLSLIPQRAHAFTGGMLCSVATYLLGAPLLSGAWISAQSWSWVAHALLVICACGVGHVARMVFQRAAAWTRGDAFAGSTLIIVLLFLNGEVLVGLYPTLHDAMLLAAWVLASAATHVLLAPQLLRGVVRNRLLALAAFALVPVLAAFALHAPSAADEAALVARVPALAKLKQKLRGSGLTHDAAAPEAEPALLDPWFKRPEGDYNGLLDQTLPARRKLNLLVISVDTVRADSTGFLGTVPSPTPVADALAKDALVFEHAITPYPTSNFAYSSLFTGLHARIAPAMAEVQKTHFAFPPRTTLAECCAAAGMATAAQTAFNAATAGDNRWFGHLRRGFAKWNPHQGEDNATAREVADSTMTLVDEAFRQRGFVWMHVLEPHSPYEAAPFAGAPAGRERYFGEISVADHEVGRVLQRVKERGLQDNTIIVWMADHGEEFGERGGAYHNTSLFEEQTHVPLLVRIPGIAARRVTSVVSLADLMPTLLEIMGIEDALPRTARSLVPLLFGAGPAEGLATAELFKSGGDEIAPAARALWAGSMKYVVRQDTGTEEVFDLARDPAERENLVGRDTSRDTRLRKLLASMDARIDAHHGGAGPAFDEDAPERWRARLRAARAALPTGAGSELDSLLFDPFGDPRAATMKHLGKAGLQELLREELARIETLPDLAEARLLMLAARAGMKAELEACWEQQRGQRITVALGLAWLGDGRGRELLLAALRSGVGAHALISAGSALARLGDKEAIPWLWLALQSGDWSLVAGALDSLGALPEVPDKVAVFGDRLRHARDVPAAVALRVLKVLAAESSPDASHLVAHLSQHEDAEVRAAARTLLGKRLGAEAAEDEVRRSALEIEADVALENRNPVLAARKYEDAWRGGNLHRSRTRLLSILALTQAGSVDASRALASEEAKTAPEHWLRPVFERAPSLSDARVRPLTDVSAKVEVLGALPDVGELGSVAVPIRITNTGSLPWPGGFGPFAAHLEVRFVTAEGRVLAPEVPLPVPLPEQGLLSGESIVLHCIAHRPRDSAGAHPELRFFQRWFHEPEGVVLQALR